MNNISYKLYLCRNYDEGYDILDERMTLNELFSLLKDVARQKFKKFLVVQNIDDSECAIFVGYDRKDVRVFIENAFIPFVRPRKIKQKKKI